MDTQLSKPVRIGIITLLSIASLFLAVKTVGAVVSWTHHSGASDSSPRITVDGTGDAFAIPTTATFSFSVIETADTVEAAQTKATDRTNKALDYLKNQAVQEKDIKTIDYNVNPQYSYDAQACAPSAPCKPGQPVLTGYQVSETIQVKVNDTTKAGSLLSGLGSLGVQNMSSLSLTVEDDDAVKREARDTAIKDAEAKAAVLAQDLGVKLGKIVDFQETNANPGPIFYAKAAAMDSAAGSVASAPEIPAGQNKVTSNVSITYEIK